MSGVFPLSLYLLELLDNARRGVVWDSLWICHLANLLMGIGALGGRPMLVRMGVLWMMAGTPLWVRELWVDPSIGPVSYLSHIGGLAFALLWLRRAAPEDLARPAWFQAWLFFVAVRALCRLITPDELNVNASRLMRDGFETVFTSYWPYWALSSLAAAAVLLALDTGTVAVRLYALRWLSRRKES